MLPSVSPLAGRRYLKMNGLGNEIVVLDLRGTSLSVAAADARALAASPRSAFDQLMVLHDPARTGADASLLIYNADGSSAGACGNGMRCVGWAMWRDGGAPLAARSDLVVDGPTGPLRVARDGPERFTIDMGPPRLRWDEIPLAEPFEDTRRIELQIGPIDAPILHSPSCVSMGNPHAVFWVDDPGRFDLARIGPLLEHHPIFPDRANISLAAVPARDRIVLRVWERGAGLTLACGTAACAALVAAVRLRLTERTATVTLPGGDLSVTWREVDDHVLMAGPAAFEHEGVIPPDLHGPAEASAA